MLFIDYLQDTGAPVKIVSTLKRALQYYDIDYNKPSYALIINALKLRNLGTRSVNYLIAAYINYTNKYMYKSSYTVAMPQY